MKKRGQSFLKIFTSDNLPFNERILNYICFLGALSAIIVFLARIIEGVSLITIGIMVLILASIVSIFLLSLKRLKSIVVVRTVVLFALSLMLWPLIFFTNGGAASGIAAFFTVSIILDFILLSGTVRNIALILSTAVIIFCYTAEFFLGFKILPEGGPTVRHLFIDNVQAILISGFFVGAVMIFQNRVYMVEKTKVEAANTEIRRNEDLLTLINESASLLLSTEPDMFEAAITESMKKMGNCLDIDRIFIWRAEEHDKSHVYVQILGWTSPDYNSRLSGNTASDPYILPRISEWDDMLFSKQGYISALADNFTDFIRTQLSAIGVKAVMAFPVFIKGGYWGFVSYENFHNEQLCSQREASILQSISLLLANAVERSDNIKQLNERLAQQQLMSNISKSFITKESMDTQIQNALASMGEFLHVVRALIAVFEKDTEISRPQYAWFTDPKYKPNISQKGFSKIIQELFPHRHNENDENQAIYCDNTLTFENGKFKIFYERGGLWSFICAPIYVNGELWGVMSIEEHERFRRWNHNDAMLVSTVSSAISSAVARALKERERTEALEQAIQASRAKGDFLSNMSHEMRTPMNAIIGMTIIGKSSNTIEKKDYAFEKIDNASKHLLGVINDILDMSKIEANKLELSSASFDFEMMIQKVVNVINFRVDERRQLFYVNIDNNIPHILIGDDQRLSQVITNLLSNAVKFTPEEGSVHLDAHLVSEKDDKCCIEISVSDSGIGITDEQKARLFHSFEQAEAGTSRKYGGTGLGLAISKRIVELMGGSIWVESEPDHGSKFAFTVILQRGSKEVKRLLPQGVDWNNLRIFAVDDDYEICQFFRDTSMHLGVFCTVATSGEKAAELLAQDCNYDIFFLDWKLPGMNGNELAKIIRDKTEQKSIVILFSSIDWSMIEDDAREAGVDKFLPKPLFQSSIVDIINECIGVGQPQEQSEKSNMGVDYSGHTIILAEDVEINREIVLSLLESTNLTIECAENGAQALKMFEEAPDKYDMIFMDVQMPEMDGYEATMRIRDFEARHKLNLADSGKAFREIPIIAMTANVFKEDVDRCIKAGMNSHVGKPLNYDEVINKLNIYLVPARKQ